VIDTYSHDINTNLIHNKR